MLCLPLLPRREVPTLHFQSEFSMSKIIQLFLGFFSLENNNLGLHFFTKIISGPIFDKAAKLGKAT